MERTIFRPHSRHMEYPGIRIVPIDSPLCWLRDGATDLRRSWPISLGYGVVFAGLGSLLAGYAWSQVHLAMAMTTGFLLLAPFLAIGFYDLSRQIDAGMRPSIRHSLIAWRGNASSIGLYAALLIILLIAWERMSAILVALFLTDNTLAVESLVGEVMTSGGHMAFVVAYTVFGAVLAAVVFALSVVSLPMLLDRKVNVATALMTSLWAVRENPQVMLLWAAIIVALIAVGYLTYCVGLVFFFPLLGHATWRAYRDLIEPSLG
ncbi:MAG: DUF2189 domain-containing protein [Gammaproteobacteria bacterium]|nr:DUF2189 domain-containing protein [Gammaproteobacteria bacterium]